MRSKHSSIKLGYDAQSAFTEITRLPVDQVLNIIEGADFIAVNFSDEQESVLFLPHSGEVLVASSESVANLGFTDSHSVQSLQQMLTLLGVDFS